MDSQQIRNAIVLLNDVANAHAAGHAVFDADMADHCAALANEAGVIAQRLGDMHAQIVADNDEILRLRQLVRDAHGYVQTLADSPDSVDYADARRWMVAYGDKSYA